MRWFRSKRGAITWLACFALACQLFASFGHVHVSKANDNIARLALAGSVGHSPAADPSSPPRKNPTIPDDICAICASISMAGTLVVPAAPIVDIPASFVQVLPWSLATTEPNALDRIGFDARGPPQAA
jgi:hypothetical protein